MIRYPGSSHNSLHSKTAASFYAALCCILLLYTPSSVQADPINEKVYLTILNGTSLALDTYRNRLYIGVDSAANNLVRIDLDAQGDTITSGILSSVGGQTRGLSLDAQRNKLYLANNVIGASGEVFVSTLDASGNIAGSIGYDSSNSAAQALVLDAERNRLYVGLADGSQGLSVITLTPAGDAISHVPHITNNQANTLALDAARNKLYVGYNNGAVGTCDLDGAGDIIAVNNTRTAGAGAIVSLALDSTYNRLYVVSNADNTIYTFDLENSASANPGELLAGPDSFGAGTAINCLTLDATRQRLYFGVSAALTNDLRWYDLNASHYPQGAPGLATADDVRAIAFDAERQKLYTVTGFSNRYYDLSDNSMPFFRINGGAVTTLSTTVNLEWSVPNAQFVRVESPDLVNYDFPAPNNTTFNTWYSTGDERWGTVPATRANTLTVQAELTSGNGDKYIGVWFKEDAGASNAGGVSHYRGVTITLSSAGTPTFTPTVTPTGTISPSPTFTSTVTLSHTPSPTPTMSGTPTVSPTDTATPTISPTWTVTPPDTATHTPTFSATPTITPTHTITPSSTATPTLTETPYVSPTPSSTVTPTASITRTSTVSATITQTPTITPTLPPTATPTPAAIFFLDKNRFTPGREQLALKIGLLPGESGELKVFTLSGRLVWQRNLGVVAGSYQQIIWDGRNQSGETVASGVYFLVVQRGDQKIIRKVLVIK